MKGINNDLFKKAVKLRQQAANQNSTANTINAISGAGTQLLTAYAQAQKQKQQQAVAEQYASELGLPAGTGKFADVGQLAGLALKLRMYREARAYVSPEDQATIEWRKSEQALNEQKLRDGANGGASMRDVPWGYKRFYGDKVPESAFSSVVQGINKDRERQAFEKATGGKATLGYDAAGNPIQIAITERTAGPIQRSITGADTNNIRRTQVTGNLDVANRRAAVSEGQLQLAMQVAKDKNLLANERLKLENMWKGSKDANEKARIELGIRKLDLLMNEGNADRRAAIVRSILQAGAVSGVNINTPEGGAKLNELTGRADLNVQAPPAPIQSPSSGLPAASPTGKIATKTQILEHLKNYPGTDYNTYVSQLQSQGFTIQDG